MKPWLVVLLVGCAAVKSDPEPTVPAAVVVQAIQRLQAEEHQIAQERDEALEREAAALQEAAKWRQRNDCT